MSDQIVPDDHLQHEPDCAVETQRVEPRGCTCGAAGQGPLKTVDNGFGGYFEGHAEVFVADFGKGMLYPLRIDGRSP